MHESRLRTDNTAHLLSHVDNDHFNDDKGAQNVNGMRHSGGIVLFGHLRHLAIKEGKKGSSETNYPLHILSKNKLLFTTLNINFYQSSALSGTSNSPITTWSCSGQIIGHLPYV